MHAKPGYNVVGALGRQPARYWGDGQGAVSRATGMEDGAILMPVEETPERRNDAEFRANNNKAIQEHLRAGDPNKAAEVLVDALTGPGGWQRLPEPRKQVVLDNIYTTLGDKMIRPSTTCDQLKKFDFPVLLMTAEKSPRSYAFFYGEMKKCAAFPDPIVIPGASHNVHGGNVEAYNKALMTFFEQAEAKWSPLLAFFGTLVGVRF